MTVLHRWDLSPSQAREVQERLRGLVVTEDALGPVRLVAGVDCAFHRGTTGGGHGRAAIALLAFPDLQPVEQAVAAGPATFPYVPGLLSFRESPLVLKAAARLSRKPDLLVVDGHGLAHPRRLGIACHLGLLLDVPTIGCAKSPLVGRHEPPGLARGAWAPVVDGGETIGAALRTKQGVRPVYVSVGHRVSLERAVELVLRCCRGYRLPEPIRWAHRLASAEMQDAAEVPN